MRRNETAEGTGRMGFAHHPSLRPEGARTFATSGGVPVPIWRRADDRLSRRVAGVRADSGVARADDAGHVAPEIAAHAGAVALEGSAARVAGHGDGARDVVAADLDGAGIPLHVEVAADLQACVACA